VASRINGQHPLQTRLSKYDDAQNEIRMENIRRVVGPGEAIRRTMELEFVKKTGYIPNIMGGPSRVHQDILENRETRVDWEDIYKEEQGISNLGLHSEMRKRMGL
jgi:proteasome maturation protein